MDLIRLFTGQASNGRSEDDKPQENGLLSLPPGPSRQNSGKGSPRSPSFQTIGESLLAEAIKAEMDVEHCLISLSVRNVYGVPFEVALSRKDGGPEITANRLVPPGATER